MNKKVYKTLEYYKILDRLQGYASCDKARKLCRNLEPSFNMDEINTWQKETYDGLNRIFKIGSISFEGAVSMGEYAKRLDAGAVLSSADLLAIAKNLSLAKNAISYNSDKKDSSLEDSLDIYFGQLDAIPDLYREITRCIISEGEFSNNASTALADLRHKRARLEDKIRSVMQKQLSSLSEYLQDQIITTRGSRFCLSVRAEHKSRVPGMVHDTSASGQTLFIEPMAVVELNNQIREIDIEESEEINRILTSLSELAAQYTAQLNLNFKNMAKLDFIFAKAKYAEALNAIRPEFNTDGIIMLKQARHPLLNPSTVVPTDIYLGDSYSMLIITGPNTGGKTVSLKTCGLLTLMGQAGLHIPAKDQSKLAIFENVYADIGDEQSIEQSLSTFSSHMTNIVRILDGVASAKANGHEALVLFDELCAGTDPAEGAALATSILEHLLSQGVKTMATTHYSELKLFALSTEGVENASLEFSVEDLTPTYRLLYGIPGKSNAFAISSKLGLKSNIIENAKSHIDEDSKSFEDLIVDLETKRIQIERDSYDIAHEKARILEEGKNLDAKINSIDEKKESIIKEAHAEAATILARAKSEADEAIRNIRKYKGADADMRKLEQTRTSVGKKLSNASKKASSIPDNISNNNIPKELHIGDSVKVLSMNMTGTVHTLPNDKGDLTVQMGIMQSKVNISDLVLIEEKDALAEKYGYASRKAKNPYLKGKQSKKSSGGINKAASVSYEIKLLGMTGDEAIAALDKYLDDAYIAHLPSVRVVHGKGTGVLRQRVHQYLKKHPHVDNYHLAEFGEGDAGVTIVEFK